MICRVYVVSQDTRCWLVLARDEKHACALVRGDVLDEGVWQLRAVEAAWTGLGDPPRPPPTWRPTLPYGIWWPEDWVRVGYGVEPASKPQHIARRRARRGAP